MVNYAGAFGQSVSGKYFEWIIISVNQLFSFFKNILLRLSLHLRSNLTPVSNVCKAALISLFRALNGHSELPEMRFKFPFKLIGFAATMAF